VVKRLSSPVPRPGWLVVAVICVSVAILGSGAYYFISTQTGKNENGYVKRLAESTDFPRDHSCNKVLTVTVT
jgi:hypothetical protein